MAQRLAERHAADQPATLAVAGTESGVTGAAITPAVALHALPSAGRPAESKELKPGRSTDPVLHFKSLPNSMNLVLRL